MACVYCRGTSFSFLIHNKQKMNSKEKVTLINADLVEEVRKR